VKRATGSQQINELDVTTRESHFLSIGGKKVIVHSFESLVIVVTPVISIRYAPERSTLMKRNLICLAVLCTIPTTSFAKAGNDWIIQPGVRVGPITSTTTEKDLAEMFGSSNVVRSQVYVGEGQSLPGTTVYPNYREKTLYILWESPGTRSNPLQISIKGQKSLWKTSEGITLGTALKVIEKINGGPFTLAGFGWDYSGGIYDSNGGKLKELENNLRLRVAPNSDLQSTPEYISVIGDHNFLSDNPAMQKINPSVYSMQVTFKK